MGINIILFLSILFSFLVKGELNDAKLLTDFKRVVEQNDVKEIDKFIRNNRNIFSTLKDQDGFAGVEKLFFKQYADYCSHWPDCFTKLKFYILDSHNYAEVVKYAQMYRARVSDLDSISLFARAFELSKDESLCNDSELILASQNTYQNKTNSEVLADLKKINFYYCEKQHPKLLSKVVLKNDQTKKLLCKDLLSSNSLKNIATKKCSAFLAK